MERMIAELIPLSSAGFAPPAAIAEPCFELRTHAAGDLLKLAIAEGRPEIAGAALVNRCIDDALEAAAAPLCFTPCVTVAPSQRAAAEGALLGVEQGCRATGARLVAPRIDLAELSEDCHLGGTLVGVRPAGREPAAGGARTGDVLFGLGSTGLHSQGHALALSTLREAGLGLRDPLPAAGATVASLLLAGHKCYGGVLRDLLSNGCLRALAHVDAGGLTGALQRLLADDLDAEVELGAWPLPPLFAALLRARRDGAEPLLARLNMGVGMVLCVAPENADSIAAHLGAWAEPHWRIGRIVRGTGRASYQRSFRQLG